MQTIGKFGYRVDYLGATPLGYILLANHSTLQTGEWSMTPQMTELEVDAHVQALKDVLDAVAIRLKRIMHKRQGEGKVWYPGP